MSDILHSPFLFIEEDCVQMKFNIRSCKNRHKLRAMIEHGGGLVQGTVGEDIIQLRERGCKVLNVTEKETVLSVQYIFDCVEKNTRLDMNKYILKLEPSIISDISSHSDGNNGSDNENNSDSDAYKNSKKYPKVSFDDDKRIIHFLLTNCEKFINKSKKFMYQQMMQENIVNCSKKTFDRHLNYIYCNISIYKLSRSEENLLSEILLIKTQYSRKDDLKIIDCILRNRFYRKKRNRKLFKIIAKYCDLDRPAKSVIKHFTGIIQPNLDRYGLSDHDMRLIMSLKKTSKNANIESVHSCDNSNNEESSSEHDFVNAPSRRKKSKHSKPHSIKTNPDNPNVYYKPFSVNDLHHQRKANAIQKTNCVKSDFMSKPRFCEKVAKKRQHFETHRSAGFSSDIDEFSSDEEIDQTYKSKKSSPLSRNRERTTFHNFSKPSSSSDKHDMVQNHMVNGTKKCTTSSKQDFKEAVGNSNVNISKKITSTLQEIAVTFNLGNEDTAIRDRVFSHNLNQASASGNGLNKEEIMKNEAEQAAAEEKITRCSDSTQVRMQQGLKFFDLEKCSLSFPDTLEDMVLEDDSPLLSQPHLKPASSDRHMVKDFCKEEPTELTSSLEPETILLVLAEKSEQPISSNHSNISQSIMQNSNAWVSDDPRDLIGRKNLKDSNKPEANLQANGIQQNNEVEDDDIEDIQIAETPEEILRPTPLFVPETQSPGESEIIEVADEKPSALPERHFFTEVISVLKRIEEVIVKIDGNYDLKNDLQNTVNELFSLMYQQRFKCSIRSIMKKNKLSITDKALLLKYIAYTRCEKPQDLVHELRS